MRCEADRRGRHVQVWAAVDVVCVFGDNICVTVIIMKIIVIVILPS